LIPERKYHHRDADRPDKVHTRKKNGVIKYRLDVRLTLVVVYLTEPTFCFCLGIEKLNGLCT
jgi:hypothetical protein